MQPLKARVGDGKVIVEDKAELPNGEIYLLPLSLDEARTAQLDRELLVSLSDEDARNFEDFDEVVSTLGPKR